MLSTSACVTICARDAPIAMRTAVCVRRATERASSRFATLAQAISSTSPQTAISSCRLLAYCSFITPTPAPAGTMRMVCFGSRCSTSDSQFAGQPASCGIHWRRTPVSRGATPSVVAPGLSRPIDAQPGGTGCRSSELPPAISGSCCSRDPEVGRVVAQRVAEETRRRDAGDGERVAFDDERLADERFVAAVGRLPRVMTEHDDGR